MDLLHHLALGFGVALTPINLLHALFGAVLGTLIGVLPGLGSVATIAMLLPAIHALGATPALIMLAGICSGARYGGSTAAILVHAPGGSSSVVTRIDGWRMARLGRAGPVLAAAALGSFFAGCVGTLVLAALAAPLAALASRFGPAETFSLLVLGLIGAVVLASGSLGKAIATILLGLLLGQVGTDVISGVARYGFGIPELGDGIGFVVVAIGVFGLGETIARLGRPTARRELIGRDLLRRWPTREDVRWAWPAVVRGSALGSILGVLPGAGARLAAFAAYAVERKTRGRSGEPPLGEGNVRGVAGPASALHAGSRTCFVPLLALGIPPDAAMALIAGALMIKGIQPGPQAMGANPQLFWGLIASLWVVDAILIVLELPLIGLRNRLLMVSWRFLVPAIVVFCAIGAYTLNRSAFDVFMSAIFCAVGYLFHKLGCEPGPLLLGFILGPTMEEHLRRALLLSRGDWSIFVTRPLSAAPLIGALALVLIVMLPSIRNARARAFQGD